jgi:hypothetical protein
VEGDYEPLYMKMNTDDSDNPFIEVVGYHTNYNLLVAGDAKRFLMDTDAAQVADNMTTKRENNSYSGTLCYSWDNQSGQNPQPWSAGDCAEFYGIASGEGTEDETWEYTTWSCLDAFTCAGTEPATENAATWEALDTSAGYRWGQIDIADDGMYADCYDWDSLVADAAFSRLYESQTLDAFTSTIDVTIFPVAYLCYENRVLSCNVGAIVDADAGTSTPAWVNADNTAWMCIEGGGPATCADCWSVVPGVIANEQ